MVSIDWKGLSHLEKLANIKINNQEEGIFLEKLDSIVNKLDELNRFDTDGVYLDKTTDNPLRTIHATKDFSWKGDIIKNVKHDVVNNSIVIKSALS